MERGYWLSVEMSKGLAKLNGILKPAGTIYKFCGQCLATIPKLLLSSPGDLNNFYNKWQLYKQSRK